MSEELIHDLEAAPEGSRALNIAIGRALGLIDDQMAYTHVDGNKSRRGNCDPWPDWTGSTDAALRLLARVLSGWSGSLHFGDTPPSVFMTPPDVQIGEGAMASASLMGQDDIEKTAATCALAVCAGIIAAKIRDEKA